MVNGKQQQLHTIAEWFMVPFLKHIAKIVVFFIIFATANGSVA